MWDRNEKVYHVILDKNIKQIDYNTIQKGFLLDGYPLYGPLENGVIITNEDLDVYHGHDHDNKEYPNGTYHYHITEEAPYINGGQFYGVPGTYSN